MKWADDGSATAADETRPDTFWHADLTVAADLLVEIIREVRPQVLVTYDQFGGYGHPDHVQAHRVATYAAALAAVRSYRPELGEAWDIAKIYWARDVQVADGRGHPARCATPATTTTLRGLGPRQPAVGRDRRRARRRGRGRRTTPTPRWTR